MRGVIDRIEGDFVTLILDDGDIKETTLEFMPTGAREGDVVEIDGANVRIDRAASDLHKDVNPGK